ncbi:hypothetical protein GCM10010449_84770 [Streptomyces rectiviolaceus]|uniref:Uncharacterized protein n=1 Tax=Streptomyces rectiviolaceus TaxID=332591 RepID=A0ABP6NQJ4_9ACTN
MGRVPARLRGGREGFCEAVQPRGKGLYEAGAVLGAAGGAFQWCGQASVGFAEDDFGGGAILRKRHGDGS